MKRFVLIVALLLLSAPGLKAQYRSVQWVTFQSAPSDTVMLIEMAPIYVFPKKADTRLFQRLVDNLKIVYPIAKEANRLLVEIEAHVLTLKTERERQAYIKEMEQMLKQKYTPIIKNMTFSQGKVLIKLIDRETSKTSYQLVKDLRGGFSAFFWQSLARLFGANLKTQYSPETDSEDRLIEQLITLYDRGLI